MRKMSPMEKMCLQSLEKGTSKMHAAWGKAIRLGDISVIRALMEDSHVSPNFSANVTGENPLKKLLLSDTRPDIYIHQETIAHLLISRGVELRVPDKFFMVPADYALLSNNREAALTVVRETIRQYHEAGRGDYVPSVDAFFATRLDTETRINRHYHLTRNHDYIGKNLIEAQNANYAADHYAHYLSNDQQAYWSRPYQRKLSDMPYYTTDFSRAMKEKRTRIEGLLFETGEPVDPKTRPHNWNTSLSIEEAHDIGYRATVKRVMELRR